MSWLIILQTSGALCCSFALHNKISKALSTMKQSLLLLVATLISTHAFQTGTIIADRSRAASGPLFSSTVAGEETAVKNDALLKRDRYVATNRFTVRQGRAAKFEKRWGKLCFYICIISLISLFFFHVNNLMCTFYATSRSLLETR
jgi:hypothetical protein